MKRWTATATYRAESGPLDVDYDFDEFDELGMLMERGPTWDTIIKVKIVLARPVDHSKPTVEQTQRPDYDPIGDL